MESHRIALLGGGFIGDFYTTTLHGQRSRDRVRIVYARDEARGRAFSERWDVPDSTTDMVAAIEHPDVDVVIVALPNHLHEEAVVAAAKAGKAVLCTKPLGRTADEAKRMLEFVAETAAKAGLEDYRLIVNVGPGGGQTVFHLHWHLLGGASLPGFE